ncbi:unnamed protein product [Sphagnum balticum]
MIRTNLHTGWCRPVRSSAADGETRAQHTQPVTAAERFSSFCVPTRANGEQCGRTYVHAGLVQMTTMCRWSTRRRPRSTIHHWQSLTRNGRCTSIAALQQ